MSKLQTRNAFTNTSLQDTDLFWIETDLGGGTFESQKITGLQLKTILSQDPIVNDVVFIDQNTPTTGGVTFDPNTPLTQDILYISTTNGSTWIYNGSTYVTYTLPTTATTPFYLTGTTVDAGGNKTSSIKRDGDIVSGGEVINAKISNITGISQTSNGYSQIQETTYSDTYYPIIRQTRRRGNSGVNTGAINGDILGIHTFNSAGDAASISVKATETHGLTTRGSEIILSNCANGTASQVENLKVQQDGKIKVSNAYTLPSTAPTSGKVLGYSSAGVSDWVTASGGLTNFTEARSTTAPNTATNVDSLTAVASTTDADISIVPKGNGAFQLAIPDNTATGGNKRGQYAVDLQMSRSNTNQVASANYSSVLGGQNNRATGVQSTVAGGINNLSSGAYSFTAGYQCTASLDSAISLGYINTASGNTSIALGYQNTASNSYSVSIGRACTSSGVASVSIGEGANSGSNSSIAIGYQASTFNTVSNRISFGGGDYGYGYNQKSILIVTGQTTDTTTTTLTVRSASTTNASFQFTLENNQLLRFKGSIVGKQTGTTNIGVWDIDGVIVRGANAGTTTLVAPNVNLVTNASGWGTPILSANTTLGCLSVQVIGLAGTNIRWTGSIETTEVIY